MNTYIFIYFNERLEKVANESLELVNIHAAKLHLASKIHCGSKMIGTVGYWDREVYNIIECEWKDTSLEFKVL